MRFFTKIKIPFHGILNNTIILIGVFLFTQCFLRQNLFGQSAKVLIIQDEITQMEVLSSFLTEKQDDVKIDIVDQDHIPGKLTKYNAVILYIHLRLFKTTEEKVINYTEEGGRLIVLHHSISSGKAKNEHFFPFLGIQLDGTENARDPELPGSRPLRAS